MAPTERKNCGYPGISAAECRKAGCCFSNSVAGVPWCFAPKAKKGNISARNTDLPSGGLCRNVYNWGAALLFFLGQQSGHKPLLEDDW